MDVLISRCAWHRRYYGFGKLLGVSRGGEMRVSFTDGICRKCATRVRSDFKVSRIGGGVPADRRAWMPGVALVVLAVMALVLLIARPTHDVPASSNVALRPPLPEGPEPAASPLLAAPSAGVTAHPGPAVAARPSPARIRETNHLGRPVPRATLVPRGPRDSAQSP
ncbi:MAG TPA: hypothetical protein VGD07_02285 [Methylomirabilota bacterium]